MVHVNCMRCKLSILSDDYWPTAPSCFKVATESHRVILIFVLKRNCSFWFVFRVCLLKYLVLVASANSDQRDNVELLKHRLQNRPTWHNLNELLYTTIQIWDNYDSRLHKISILEWFLKDHETLETEVIMLKIHHCIIGINCILIYIHIEKNYYFKWP